MPAGHAGRDILAETIRGIDVERGATGELNRIFGLKLMKLLKERLPDIGNGHLTSNPDFHLITYTNTEGDTILTVYNIRYNNATSK